MISVGQIFRVAGLCLFLTNLLWSEEPPSKPSVEALIKQVDEVTKAMEKVVDLQSAKDNREEIAKWQNSAFASKDRRTKEWWRKLVPQNEGLMKSLAKLDAEAKRIQQLEDDVFIVVLRSLHGKPPLDFVKQFEETAKVLNQIRSEEDLERLAKGLQAAWKPIGKMMKEDLKGFFDFMEFATKNEPYKSAIAAQRAAVRDIEKIDVALAEKAGEVMMGKRLMKKLKDHEKELIKKQNKARIALEKSRKDAKMSLQNAKTTLDIALLMPVLDRYDDEYGEFPWPVLTPGKDRTILTNRAFVEVLQGKDKGKNPKGIDFLGVEKEDGRLVDSWGNLLRVIIDSSGDKKVKLPKEYGSKIVVGKAVAYSAGPDGKFETIEDNITSWTTEDFDSE